MTKFSKSALIAALLTSSSLAYASPTPADIESARALYVSGKELREAGDLRASLEKFKAAHALVPTPITALELAHAYVLLDKPLEARQLAMSVERLPVAPDESRKAAAARDEARALDAKLSAVIPSLVLVLKNHQGMSSRVLIDGEIVPTEALSVPRKVNPGHHVVVGQTEEGETTVAIDLNEGESKNVVLDFEHIAPRPAKTEIPKDVPGTPSTSSPLPTHAGHLQVALRRTSAPCKRRTTPRK